VLWQLLVGILNFYFYNFVLFDLLLIVMYELFLLRKNF
jgi:hypothetical protein